MNLPKVTQLVGSRVGFSNPGALVLTLNSKENKTKTNAQFQLVSTAHRAKKQDAVIGNN